MPIRQRKWAKNIILKRTKMQMQVSKSNQELLIFTYKILFLLNRLQEILGVLHQQNYKSAY